jgi:Uma2 family endonuclease
MATTTFVPVETYLRMESEPDCEYVDGQIEERPMPEYDHSTWQDALSAFFRSHGVEWNVRARPELRVRVSPTRFRVPDVTVLSRAAPIEQIVVTPPLAVFEILSPENRMAAMMEKFADYERMGIAGIWIIDPRKSVENAIGYGYQSGKLETVTNFGLPSLGITFTIHEVAAFID